MADDVLVPPFAHGDRPTAPPCTAKSCFPGLRGGGGWGSAWLVVGGGRGGGGVEGCFSTFPVAVLSHYTPAYHAAAPSIF